MWEFTDHLQQIEPDRFPVEHHHSLYQELPYEHIHKVTQLVEEFQRADIGKDLNLYASHLIEYLIRGGKVILVEPETKIMIDRNDLIITGCNAGMCRSQATAGFLRKHGVVVDHVIAGRDSAINYTKKNPILRHPVASEKDAHSFHAVFNCHKLPQLGHHLGPSQLEILDQAREYYVDFMQSLTNQTHFLVFGMSGPVILLHLLQRTGTLEGFKITYFNWADTISHCTEKHSIEAYQSFMEQLQCHFVL